MYYIKYLDKFRAILCSSSGGQNCIFTACGIVTLCERPYSAPVESGLRSVYVIHILENKGIVHQFCYLKIIYEVVVVKFMTVFVARRNSACS
jgi:hypothetical protein